MNAASASGGIDPGSRGYPHRAQFPQGLHERLAVRSSHGDGGGPARVPGDDGVPAGGLATPRGLESHRVEQMGETFWRMRRSQRIRDGLALKNIKVPGEDMAATVRSFQAFEAMEPFERLKKAR